MVKNGELEVQKVIVVGAGPVGALAALYAGKRGDEVHVYELRDGEWFQSSVTFSAVYSKILYLFVVLLFPRNGCFFSLSPTTLCSEYLQFLIS